jgi:hypothetical protein
MCFIASIQTAIMVGVGVGELVFMEGISLSRLDQSLYTRVYFFISIFFRCSKLRASCKVM